MKSATNLQIKSVKALHQKKNREEMGLFIAEGYKLIAELMRYASHCVESIFIRKDFENSINIDADKLFLVSDKQMEQISALSSASSILALCKMPKKIDVIPSKLGFSLYLDKIKDPGNMGTIVRTAHWFGVSEIFLSPECVDLYNPKCVQATMGSIFDIKSKIIELKELVTQYTFSEIYGALLDGKDLETITPKPNSLLIIGSESHGISPENASLLSQPITIARYNTTESLNASIAAGIIMNKMASGLRIKDLHTT